ncbi:LGFP repeat-containing protein [Nocardia testacea]|uniref:LGFP repeat-containing protein n=1 Tax=Nocardia testacea TaxID=248551 RepID=UPI003A89D5AE
MAELRVRDGRTDEVDLLGFSQQHRSKVQYTPRRSARTMISVAAACVIAAVPVLATAQPSTPNDSPTPPPSTSTTVPPPTTAPPPSPSAPSPPSPTDESSAPPSSAPPPAEADPPPSEQHDCEPGEKSEPESWQPTADPQATIEPGQMRSDCEVIPGGFTKEEADRAETMEAALTPRPGARSARVAAGCQVYWPAPYEVCGAIRDKYNALGGPNSFLLWPTSNELTNPDGVGKRTVFQNGPIYWSPWGGAHPVVNHFFAAWQRHGWEAGYLGYPTTDEIPAANGGLRQEFDGAAIYWHLNEAYAIGGSIREKWNTVGAEGGPLGYPNSDELPVNKNNGRYNNFENGTITWSGPTGARLLYGAVRDRWASFGREDGEMGLPMTDEQVTADGVGHFVNFEDGSAIYWYPVIGAWRIPRGIMSIFAQFGYETGRFGYPTTDVSQVPVAQGSTGAGQGFQRGSIIYVDKGGTYDYYTATY